MLNEVNDQNGAKLIGKGIFVWKILKLNGKYRMSEKGRIVFEGGLMEQEKIQRWKTVYEVKQVIK